MVGLSVCLSVALLCLLRLIAVLSDCQTAEYQVPVCLLLFSPWLSVSTFRLFGRAVCLPFRLLALSVCCDLSLPCPTARLKTTKCLSVFYCASRLGCLSQSSDCSVGLSVCLSVSLLCLSAVTCGCPVRLPDCRLPSACLSYTVLALAVCLGLPIVQSGCLSAFQSPCSCLIARLSSACLSSSVCVGEGWM